MVNSAVNILLPGISLTPIDTVGAKKMLVDCQSIVRHFLGYACMYLRCSGVRWARRHSARLQCPTVLALSGSNLVPPLANQIIGGHTKRPMWAVRCPIRHNSSHEHLSGGRTAVAQHPCSLDLLLTSLLTKDICVAGRALRSACFSAFDFSPPFSLLPPPLRQAGCKASPSAIAWYNHNR